MPFFAGRDLVRSMRASPLLLVAAAILSGCLLEPRESGSVRSHHEALLGPGFDRIFLDITYEEGAEPTGFALQHARGVLADVTGKPVDVAGPARASMDAPRAIGYERDGSALLGVRYAKGIVTHGNTTPAGSYSGMGGIMMFPDTWRGSSVLGAGPVGGTLGSILSDAYLSGTLPEIVEAEVLVHEIGHALGLVDSGAPMRTPRIDPEDPCGCHSANAGSVMYYRVHGAQQHLTKTLDAGRFEPIGFDADDLADLTAYRQGRAA